MSGDETKSAEELMADVAMLAADVSGKAASLAKVGEVVFTVGGEIKEQVCAYFNEADAIDAQIVVLSRESHERKRHAWKLLRETAGAAMDESRSHKFMRETGHIVDDGPSGFSSWSSPRTKIRLPGVTPDATGEAR